jgi:ABC-type branched-subunit amino acid transport system ATPase component
VNGRHAKRGAALLEVEAVSARYGHVVALSDVSLGVRAGEVVAVLGPNGAGKSTLVRCVAGVHRDLDGTMRLGGTELRPGLARQRRQLGLSAVGDRRDLVASLTVHRYLGLLLDHDGVDAAFALFPRLAALTDRRCGLLSGGESQMLALARALAAKPKAVVIDEISQGLAPIALQGLLPAVRAAADDGAAVLLVEQYAHAAAVVADRVVMLEHGRTTYDGPVAGAPLDEAYLAPSASAGPAPTPILTDVTVGLLPVQRRALAARAVAEGRHSGDLVRDALDSYLAHPAASTRGQGRR